MRTVQDALRDTYRKMDGPREEPPPFSERMYARALMRVVDEVWTEADFESWLKRGGPVPMLAKRNGKNAFKDENLAERQRQKRERDEMRALAEEKRREDARHDAALRRQDRDAAYLRRLRKRNREASIRAREKRRQRMERIFGSDYARKRAEGKTC